MTRGYFGIGIYHTKNPANVGTLWRSAANLGADLIFTVGRRYKQQSSDTVKAFKHIPLLHFADMDDLIAHVPHDCLLVGVEQDASAQSLPDFAHPERCIYLLGAEDHGLAADVAQRCHRLVEIPSDRCMNVAVAGSIVMYDRNTKRSVVRAPALAGVA